VRKAHDKVRKKGSGWTVYILLYKHPADSAQLGDLTSPGEPVVDSDAGRFDPPPEFGASSVRTWRAVPHHSSWTDTK